MGKSIESLSAVLGDISVMDEPEEEEVENLDSLELDGDPLVDSASSASNNVEKTPVDPQSAGRSRCSSTTSSHGGKPNAMKMLMSAFVAPSPTSSTVSSKTTTSSRSRKSRGRKRRTSEMDSPSSPVSSTISRSESSSVVSSGSKKKGKGKGKMKTKQYNVKTSSSINSESVMGVGQVVDDEYIVEKIVGRKFIELENGKQLHYHIKWKGWATAHNTWEPVENLDGCQEMVDAYERECAERKARKQNGQSDISDDSDDENKENVELLNMQKTRKEIIEYGIETKWPKHLVPLEVLGVITVDKHLCYIVKHQTHGEVQEEISTDNCVIVRASVFKRIFPHIVIKYYEKCVLFVERDEASNTDLKADTELERSKLLALDILKNDDMDMDDLDDDGVPLPKINIKKDVDLFGLPEKMNSESSSSDEDNFDELFIPVLPQPQKH